jgi:hypothetical protein
MSEVLEEVEKIKETRQTETGTQTETLADEKENPCCHQMEMCSL